MDAKPRKGGHGKAWGEDPLAEAQQTTLGGGGNETTQTGLEGAERGWSGAFKVMGLKVALASCTLATPGAGNTSSLGASNI